MGPWRLLFLIVKPAEKLYLTSNGIKKLVTVAPERAEGQKVKYSAAVPRGEKGLVHHHARSPTSKCPPGLARKKDSDEVILSETPDEWTIVQVKDDIYQLALVSHFIRHKTNVLHQDSRQGSYWSFKTTSWKD